MNLKLFDVQTSILGVKRGERKFVSVEELIEEMDFCKVEKTVTRVLPDELELDFQFTNQKLYDACNKSGGRLIPCPIVVPNSAKDIDYEDLQIDKAIKSGAPAVRIRPAGDKWEILPWISDNLFNAMVDRKMPLMISPAISSFKEIAELAQRFPEMPVIIHNVGYGSMRHFVPFLSTFKNTYLSIGSNFTMHFGIEHLVKHVGVNKLIFGTNSPVTEMMSSITQLAYSKISNEEKQLIGAGNLETLIEDIIK